MGTKYEPLRAFLENLARRGEKQVTCRFADLDNLVGGLPASARKYREWWSNSSQPHGEASWRAAGWLVQAVSFDNGSVRFERGAVGAQPRPVASGGLIAGRPTKKSIDWNSQRVVGRTEIRIAADWREAGAITMANDQVVFPSLPPKPGLYWMSLTGKAGQARPRHYFGETDNLQRRANGYRNPHPGQTTNVRLNEAIRLHIGEGGAVRLDIATGLQLLPAQSEAPAVDLDLSRKAVRVLGENAALVLAQLAGEADIENLE
jgi:hypothetical protein